MTSDQVYTVVLAVVLLAGAVLLCLEPPSPGNAPGRGPGGEAPR